MNIQKLKNAIKLERRVAVYVPATVGTATAADNSGAVDSAAGLLSELFGGATIQPGAGCWISEAVGLVKEQTTVVYAFTDSDGLERGGDRVIDFCEKMKADLQQEAVSLEIDGVLYLI